MTAADASTLIITDGGLPSLVAAAIEAERTLAARPDRDHDAAGSRGVGKADRASPPALLMPWVTHAHLAEAQLAAISSQARFLGQEMLEPAPIREFAIGTSTGFTDTLALLAAVEVARANACARIVWPVHHHATDDSLPDNLDRIAAAVDRALLVGRIAMLDETPEPTDSAETDPESAEPGVAEITIDTPLVDLTDDQIADLVVDLDAPAYLAWWWRALTGDAERTAAHERSLWRPTLSGAGWVSAKQGAQVVTSAPANRESAPAKP